MQDMGYPFGSIPLQAVQVIPDRMIAVLIGNDADGRFDFLFTGDAVLLHPTQDILHIRVVQRLAGAGPAHGLYDELRIAVLVELLFYLREGRRQIIRVLRGKNRTEAMEAVPVDVAFGSFRIDVLAVGKVETPVIVFGVIGAVGPGSPVVSC